MIKLTPRLQTVADMIGECRSFLDIGTDHAYLPAYIVENGKAEAAIASDINPNPLKNAQNTLDEEDLNGKIELRLSAGFENIKENEAEEIAIAGMGGLMIADMIKSTPWIKNKNVHLVLQPMTHFENVRYALFENGFEIEKEQTVCEGERVYLIISARYTGKKYERPAYWFYFGELLKSEKESDKRLNARIMKTIKLKCENTDDKELLEVLRSIENA